MDLTQEKHKTRCLWLENYRINFLIFIQIVLQGAVVARTVRLCLTRTQTNSSRYKENPGSDKALLQNNHLPQEGHTIRLQLIEIDSCRNLLTEFVFTIPIGSTVFARVVPCDLMS